MEPRDHRSVVFILFAYSFFKPRTTRDWRSFGAFSAFLVALFTEMYWCVFRDADGRARTTQIVIGHRNNEVGEALSGLSPGVSVVLHPSDRVVESARIAPRD